MQGLLTKKMFCKLELYLILCKASFRLYSQMQFCENLTTLNHLLCTSKAQSRQSKLLFKRALPKSNLLL